MSDINKTISYCGLCCDDCYMRKEKIADLARDLRKELRESKLHISADNIAENKFFSAFKKYNDCYEVLGAFVKLRCKKLCKEGGGNPFCVIRKCAEKKDINGCWECEKYDRCKKIDSTKQFHGDANSKNIKRIKKNGPSQFLKGKRDWFVKQKQNTKI